MELRGMWVIVCLRVLARRKFCNVGKRKTYWIYWNVKVNPPPILLWLRHRCAGRWYATLPLLRERPNARLLAFVPHFKKGGGKYWSGRLPALLDANPVMSLLPAVFTAGNIGVGPMIPWMSGKEKDEMLKQVQHDKKIREFQLWIN